MINLPNIPQRPSKLREEGLTMVMDKGLSNIEAEALMDSSKEYIDIIKFGFGTALVTNNIKDKIKLYKKNNIKVYLGGTLFEAFIIRNMFKEYCDLITKLEEIDLKARASNALGFLTKELQMLEMKNEIQSKVRTDLDKQQREFYLHQQMKAIQEELGGAGSEKEIDEMRNQASKKKWNKEVEKEFDKGLKKLQRMNPSMADYAVQRSYLELVLELPWNEFTNDKFDLKKHLILLDHNHPNLFVLECHDKLFLYQNMLILLP